MESKKEIIEYKVFRIKMKTCKKKLTRGKMFLERKGNFKNK